MPSEREPLLEQCYAQRLGSVTGEALPYFLGLPLVGGARNYSRVDAAVAEACVALLAAFAKTGEPAPGDAVAWPRYELNTQQYLSIGESPTFTNTTSITKTEFKEHYTGFLLPLRKSSAMATICLANKKKDFSRTGRCV